jgi:SAM-dependent methyltransferase
MDGTTLDWVVLNTIKNGKSRHSGKGHGAKEVGLYLNEYDIKELDYQPEFKRVLDVGSLDINGAMFKYDYLGTEGKWVDMIGAVELVGLDLIAGENVTHVGNSNKMTFETDYFDLVMSLNALEHDKRWKKSIKEMYRVLKPGGLALFNVPDETVPDHSFLGGGSRCYNFITKDMFLDALKKAKFKILIFAKEGASMLVRATK